ncbi:MAG: hypothetical protein AUG51_16625 [Acidobacteria bacterium 13_1_20CM_3_53_8]|nr:MAG: hypothetical protein AUG51_16625 [Acidobacteria bacterium 13_1_20CM_3_53_8]
MICLMRLILASSALLIIYIDPAEPDRYVGITYGALVLYTIYSAALYIISVRWNSLLGAFRQWSHWVDVAWYLLFIALSSGTNSLFFFFFFFPILVASFRHGFKSGLSVSVVSTVFFIVVGYAAAPGGSKFELNRFLLRPIYLLVLSYMMAYWGGFEIMLKRRLALLKEVMTLSNPRFGISRTIGSIMKRLCEFYDADHCLVISHDESSDGYIMRRVDRWDDGEATRPEPLAPELARLLLSIPQESAIIYKRARDKWMGRGSGYYAYDTEKCERVMGGTDACELLATTLDAESFITVPLRYRDQIIGRLYLASRHAAFNESDVDFLLHVIEQVVPIIDNIRLVDHLASDAAREERQKIARDIHDSVVQPYIGLQLGLAAINEKLSVGGFNIRNDVARLFDLTNTEIAEMRSYIKGLRGEDNKVESSLLLAVRRYAAKLSEATGLPIEVEAPATGIHINDRLAAEAFQMVTEGLSNIRRHTRSKSARLGFNFTEEHFLIEIENVVESAGATNPFTPRSIMGRAEALGGQARVERKESGATLILIEIPL